MSPPLLAHPHERIPILLMRILKISIASPSTLRIHHLIPLKESFLFIEQGRVEFNLLGSDGVDEGEDEVEEGTDEEGDVDDKGEAEAFGVVSLDYVQHLAGGGEGGMFGFVGEVDEKVKRPEERTKNSNSNEISVQEIKYWNTHSTPGPIRSTARSSMKTANLSCGPGSFVFCLLGNI